MDDQAQAFVLAEAIKFLETFGGFVATDWTPAVFHEEPGDTSDTVYFNLSLINGKGNRLWVDGLLMTDPNRVVGWALNGGEILAYL
jgi:hypothetical protein